MRSQYKVLVNIVAVLLTAMAGWGHAQDGQEVGFLRLVNIVAAGSGNLKVKLDGKDRWPQGFRLGQRTGGMGLKAGKLELALTKEGCKGAKREIDVVANETQTIVFYASPVRDENGKIIEWELKIARLRQHTPERGLFLTVLSFCEEKRLPVSILETVSQELVKVNLTKMKASRVELKGGLVSAEIKHEDTLITSVQAERRGNYVVMLYTGNDGAKKGLSFYDPKFVLAN